MSSFGEYILSAQKRPIHIPSNYNAFQLCKFFKLEDYLLDFLDGRFYMSTISSLDGYNNRCLAADQKDEYDGTGVLLRTTDDSYMMFDFSSEKPMLVQYKGKPTPENEKMQVFEAKIERNQYIYNNLYCFYSLWFDIKNKHLNPVDSRILTNFGEYGIIVREPVEFMNRIYNAIIDSKYEFNKKPTLGFVEYIDINSGNCVYMGPYKKKNSHSYQNEFRFLLDIKGNDKDLMYFEVGKVDDIVTIIKTEDLINNSYIDGDLLVIGDKKINFGFGSV